MADEKALGQSVALLADDQLAAGVEAAMVRIKEVGLEVSQTLVYSIDQKSWDNWDKVDEVALVTSDEDVEAGTLLFDCSQAA